MEYFRNAGADTAMDEATKLTVINSKQDFDKLLSGSKPVVVDYMASWCGKCAMIAPYLEELAVSLPSLYVTWRACLCCWPIPVRHLESMCMLLAQVTIRLCSSA